MAASRDKSSVASVCSSFRRGPFVGTLGSRLAHPSQPRLSGKSRSAGSANGDSRDKRHEARECDHPRVLTREGHDHPAAAYPPPSKFNPGPPSATYAAPGDAGRTNPASIFAISTPAVPEVTAGSAWAKVWSSSSCSSGTSTTPKPYDP